MTSTGDRPTVAVGLDTTPEALEALRYGAAVARHRHWDLLVVHTYEIPQAPAGLNDSLLDELQDAGDAVVDNALSGLRLGTDTQVRRVVTAESVVPMLRVTSERVAMLVLGRHRFGFGRQLLGRIGSAVAAQAACPLVVVPPGWSRAKSDGLPVVVALDAAQAARSALAFACVEAELAHVPLIAMHAVPPHGENSFISEEEASMGELVAGSRQDHPDLDLRTLLLAGDPQALLLDAATHAAMVVVGRPHRHGFGGWSGSMARAVMDRSHCPLVIAPSSTRDVVNARPHARRAGS